MLRAFAVLLAALSAAASAAQPPAFAPDADLRALKGASEAVIQAVSVVQPQPVQPDRLAIIKGGLDDVARQCAAADASVKSLVSQTDPPLAWLSGRAKEADDRAAQAAAAVAAARRRRQDASALADQLKSSLSSSEHEKDPDKPRKLSDVDKAKALLRQADEPLRGAEDSLARLDSPKSEIKERQFNAHELRFELDKAAAELSRHAGIAARASGEAKAAVDAFKDGDNATQARAYNAIGETLDAGKNASNYANTAAARVEWLGERYASGVKAQAKLDDVYRAQAKGLSDAEGPLAEAERLLADISR